MFGRKRGKEEEENLGLSAPFVTPSASVAPTASPTPTPAPAAAPNAPNVPNAAMTTGTAPIAMLSQILTGNGPIGEMIAQIKADPEGFRQRIMQQAQAAGVPTYVLNTQWTGSVGAAAAPQHVDVIDELTKAAALHDKGVLTDAEFETLKKKLLAEE